MRRRSPDPSVAIVRERLCGPSACHGDDPACKPASDWWCAPERLGLAGRGFVGGVGFVALVVAVVTRVSVPGRRDECGALTISFDERAVELVCWQLAP